MYLEMGTRKINEWKMEKISPTRSGELEYLKHKVFAVSWFIDVAMQTKQNKKLIYPSVLWQFQGIKEEKTAYCTERFNKQCQFGWPYSFVKTGGPR